VISAAVTDRDHSTARAATSIGIGLNGHHKPVTIVAFHTQHMHPGHVEQGIGPSAPARARTTRTVVHVGVFISSGSLVAPDHEGPDTLIPVPPRRPHHPCADPKSRVGVVARLLVQVLLPTRGVWIYAERVLDLNQLDVDEIATALSDQTDYEHRWLIDPRAGQVAFWTVDTGIDGQNPVDLDELDLIPIDPLPSYVWYQDMADFAEGISDDTAGRRLGRAIRGRGAFHRFRDELYEEYPDLVSVWQSFRDTRAKRRAVEWLLDQGLIDQAAGQHFLSNHPDPDLP
jgi:hypothetical protein